MDEVIEAARDAAVLIGQAVLICHDNGSEFLRIDLEVDIDGVWHSLDSMECNAINAIRFIDHIGNRGVPCRTVEDIERETLRWLWG